MAKYPLPSEIAKAIILPAPSYTMMLACATGSPLLFLTNPLGLADKPATMATEKTRERMMRNVPFMILSQTLVGEDGLDGKCGGAFTIVLSAVHDSCHLLCILFQQSGIFAFRYHLVF